MNEKILSWVNFRIENGDKPFSMDLYEEDFLFIAGETDSNKMMRGLAGFLESSNYKAAIRMHNQERVFSFVPFNATDSFPAHRTIKEFAFDITSRRSMNEKTLYEDAAKSEIDPHILKHKPKDLPLYVLQQISLWLASLSRKGKVIFVEEPKDGWHERCKPFSFLQNLIREKIATCVVYSAIDRKSILEKSQLLQFCNAKIAVFYGELLIEKGCAAEIIRNHTHPYTIDWINLESDNMVTKVHTLDWLNRGSNSKASKIQAFSKRYCPVNCAKKKICNSEMWDLNAEKEHSVICREFIK